MELSAIYDFLILLYFQKHFTIQCALQEEAKVPRRKPIQAQGKHANCTATGPESRRFKQGPSYYYLKVLTIAP